MRDTIEVISTVVLTLLIVGPMIVAAFMVGLPMGVAMVCTLLLFGFKK